MNYKKKFFKDNKGFTLIEVSIALIVAGVLLSGAMKGYQLIENAKLQSGITEINSIRVDLIDVSLTNVPTQFDINESKKLWQDLIRRNIVIMNLNNDALISKIGCCLCLVQKNNENYIVLGSNDGTGFFNFSQANKIKSKYENVLIVDKQMNEISTEEAKVYLAFKI